MATAHSIVVLHVVGGTEFRGGIADAVVRLCEKPLEGIVQRVWVHRSCRPDQPGCEFVHGGHATDVNGSIAHDARAGMREGVALASWVRQQHDGRPIILHAHTRVGLVASAVAHRLTGVPVAMHLHFLPKRPWLYRHLRTLARAEVIYNSAKTCRHFGDDPGRAFVIHPDIDWPTAPAPETGGPACFQAAGAFVPGKHFDVAVDAFEQVRREDPSAQLVLHGMSDSPADPPYQERVVSRSREVGARVAPWSRTWVDALGPSDIFVHLGAPESFGLAVLEAFARGCRLVVLPGTFLDELAPPLGEEGVFRAERLDARSVANAMSAALRSPVRPTREQRSSAREVFATSRQSPRLRRLYEKLAGSAGRPLNGAGDS